MNNKNLFINGFLERIAREYPQDSNPKRNMDLAFEIFAIAACLDKPFQEVFDHIIIKNKETHVSGSKDGGIDGIWFHDLGDFYEMYVFQCKNSPSLKDNEMDKFRNDVKDIFADGNKVGKTKINDLEPFIDEYKSISQSGKIIETKLVFIFNGNIVDANYSNNEAIYKAYHQSASLPYFVYDSNWLYDKIASVAKTHRKNLNFTFHPKNSNFSVSDHQALYTFSIDNTRAANFRVLATEICQLIEAEEKLNGTYDLLFEENIRQYLGTKFKANREMMRTLSGDEAVLFPFLNNGITIIAEQIIVPKSPQDGRYNLPVVNPQIVNGLQTSRVLYEVYKNSPEKLKGVYVNIRVYESKDPGLIEKITDATNTQTPITHKDKISNKDFNSLSKELFKNNGINYVTKRGEGFNANQNSHQQIDSELVLKFWYATFYEEPEVAKNSIGRVLQEIYEAASSENHPLYFLFNGDKDSAIYKQLLSAYKIYQLIQRNKKQLIDEDGIYYSEKYEHLLYSDEMMAYGIYKSIAKDLKGFDNQQKLQETYAQVAEVIEEQIQENKAELNKIGKTFSYNSYFKKPKCRYDFNKAQQIIQDDFLIDELKKIR